MLVKDIYGGDYSSQGLPGELIASSFGKAVACGKHKYTWILYQKIIVKDYCIISNCLNIQEMIIISHIKSLSINF